MTTKQLMSTLLPGSPPFIHCAVLRLWAMWGSLWHSEHQNNWSPPSKGYPRYIQDSLLSLYEGDICQGHSAAEKPAHHHSLDGKALSNITKGDTSQVSTEPASTLWNSWGCWMPNDTKDLHGLRTPQKPLLQIPHYYCDQEVFGLKSMLLHKVTLFVTT